MEMGIPAKHIPKSLVGYDHSSDYFFTGNCPVEIADHGEYHFRNFREELSVVAEEHPQAFWKSKYKLAMRKSQQYFLIQVFGKEKCSLLAAGGAKIKPLAGERTKIIMPAVRITAADAGYSLPVVTAGEKVLAHRLDPFEAKLPEFIGILLFIPAAKMVQMLQEI